MPGDPHSAPADAPAGVVLGVGASRGCPPDELAALVDEALTVARLPRSAVRAVASATVKADEPAILALAAALGVPARFLEADALAAVDVPTPSAVVASHVGTPSVAEAAALLVAARLAADPGHEDARPAGADGSLGPAVPGVRLLLPKRRSLHATCAIAAVAAAPRATPVPPPSEVPAP